MAPVVPYGAAGGPTQQRPKISRTPGQPSKHSFICVTCRQRKPMREMSASRAGVCERCALKPPK